VEKKMINSNIETMREGKCLPDHCKCGHLKNHHLAIKKYTGLPQFDTDKKTIIAMTMIVEEVLQCQDYVFDTEANKMLRCGCKI